MSVEMRGRVRKTLGAVGPPLQRTRRAPGREPGVRSKALAQTCKMGFVYLRCESKSYEASEFLLNSKR